MTTAAPALHIGPSAALRHGIALAGRAVTKVRKNPESLLDVTLQPIIFLLLFVYLFGGAISGNTHTYLQTLLPGLMVQNICFASMGTGMALAADLKTGVFDRFRSMPIARSAPLLGAVLGDIVRFIVTLVVLIVFAVILGFRVQTGPGEFVIAFLLMLAFGLCLCWVSVFVGMLVKSPQAVPGTLVAFMLPLTFGSTVFVGSGTMPGWLQAWVDINPVTHLTEAARGLLLGGDWAAHTGWAFLWAVAIAAVFFPLALRAYRKRVA
ncbi:ABC transporter permease [Actinokineospora enzanensis]|uniref:ABC transporter permease n=1 Tax=Actinokineospora enzanensis TaxID=155975 RepID=UPI000374FA33|nr:ABC transporter permease [Actinokineospora enzanensis]